MPAYKQKLIDTTVADAIGTGFGELQCLRDEMREWADNMENGNLGQTQKCQDVAAAADELDQYADGEPEVPEHAGTLSCQASEAVSTRRGRAPSRAVRRDNAVAFLQAAADVPGDESTLLLAYEYGWALNVDIDNKSLHDKLQIRYNGFNDGLREAAELLEAHGSPVTRALAAQLRRRML